MDDEIKISELIEATETNEEDIMPIVQNGANKKLKLKNISKILKNAIVTEEEILANTNYTIPLSYTPGTSKLEIYYEGCKLIEGENYIEIAVEGKSTMIQFKDWDVPINSNLEIIIRN